MKLWTAPAKTDGEKRRLLVCRVTFGCHVYIVACFRRRRYTLTMQCVGSLRASCMLVKTSDLISGKHGGRLLQRGHYPSVEMLQALLYLTGAVARGGIVVVAVDPPVDGLRPAPRLE